MVTVGTITYNHLPFIEKCIKGVLMQQTTFPIEFMIGEDFSTDGTREIVFEYARKYPEFIRVITADYNIGAHANSLRCFKAFRGQYIALCEGDDYWTDLLKLQKQVDFLEVMPSFVMCYHAWKINDMNTGIEKVSTLIKDFTADELVAPLELFHTSTLLFRNVFRYNRNDLPPEDLEHATLIAYLGTYGGCKFLSSIEPSVYNIHGGGIWSSLDKKEKRYFDIYYKNYICNYFIERYLEEKDDDRWVKIRLKALADALQEHMKHLYPDYKLLTINSSYAKLVYRNMRIEFYYEPLVKLIKRTIKRFLEKGK
jgi:glycosyltransferase involved in cell wall biosynthesis